MHRHTVSLIQAIMIEHLYYIRLDVPNNNRPPEPCLQACCDRFSHGLIGACNECQFGMIHLFKYRGDIPE